MTNGDLLVSHDRQIAVTSKKWLSQVCHVTIVCQCNQWNQAVSHKEASAIS